MSKQDAQPSRSETGFLRRLFHRNKPIVISQEKFLAGEDELMDPDKVVEELTAEQEAEKKEAELQVKAAAVLEYMIRDNGIIYGRTPQPVLSLTNDEVLIDSAIVDALLQTGFFVNISGNKIAAYIVNHEAIEERRKQIQSE